MCILSGQSKPTQVDKILNLLRSACGQWVSAVEVTKVSLQYSSRVHEARKLGYVIENRVTITQDGKECGSFRLVSEPVHVEAERVIEAEPRPVADRAQQQSFFELLARHRDE